ncbi:outer membrane beta-barrel family protein [Spirosoma harenae]
MKQLVLVLLLFQISRTVCAQTVTFTILDAGLNPVIGATITVWNSSDSTNRLSAASDGLGKKKVRLPTASYRYRISAVGFTTVQGIFRVHQDLTELSIQLNSSVELLQAVDVVTKKPLMVQEEDKVIINPEPLVNSSATSYELLEKVPGVFLDQTGNIYLTSTTPAVLYINGREQKMSPADLATLLKSLPPQSVHKIEILRTPSSRYEANSTGGILNIILKDGVDLGKLVSLQAGLNKGTYGTTFVGISMLNTKFKNSYYLHVNVNEQKNYESLLTTNQLTVDSVLTKHTYSETKMKVGSVGYGDTYQFNKRFGVTLDGMVNKTNTAVYSTNSSQLTANRPGSGSFDLLNGVNNVTDGFSIKQGLLTTYKLDSLGSSITADVSFHQNNGLTQQAYTTAYSNISLSPTGGLGQQNTKLSQWGIKVDLTKKVNKFLNLEMGIKLFTSTFYSSSNFSTNKQAVDTLRTCEYSYRELLSSAYVQNTQLWASYTLKVGVRLEMTKMNGMERLPNAGQYFIQRIDLFPYLYISKHLFNVLTYPLTGYLIYRRSITRPTYESLNPYPKFLDSYMYEVGNPALKPQFTHTVEANISVDNKPILAIGQNYIQDVFTNVLYVDKANAGTTYKSFDNVGTNKETYCRAVAANPPGGRYFILIGGQFNYNQYKGVYQNQPLQFNRGSFVFFTYHQVKIDARSTLLVNGFYRLKGQLQFYELGDFGSFNIAINRYFFSKKFLLTLTGSDIFYQNKNSFSLQQGIVNSSGFRQTDSRRIGLTIHYSLGTRKREEKINPFTFDNLDVKPNQ